MASSLARTVTGTCLAAGLSLLLSAATACAQDAAARSPADLSPQCEVPNGDIAAPAPLPTMTNMLESGKKLRILAIGSSSTYGIGATVRGKAYPAQLEQILEKTLSGVDVKIINRGVSGEIASATAERLKSEVALTHPNVVLWQLGTNDALSRITPEDFENTVLTAVKRLKKRNIDVVLVGLQYTPKYARDENYTGIRDALKRVAAAENVLYIRRYDAMQFLAKTRANLQMLAGDEFHLNDLGYQCMAEHVAHAVIANLFIRRPTGLPAKVN